LSWIFALFFLAFGIQQVALGQSSAFFVADLLELSLVGGMHIKGSSATLLALITSSSGGPCKMRKVFSDM